MYVPIKSDYNSTTIELAILARLQGKELWGDISFSIDDYEELRKFIKSVLEKHKFDIKYIIEKCPLALTTFLVFLARYKYKNNFWRLLAEELDISQLSAQQQNEIGECARKSFNKYKYDYSSVSNERRKNLEPILYEAGLPPESCFDDLFYVLCYDSYNVFDPQLIIEELISSRSYQIRKPMRKFLERYQDDRAVELVLEVHDAMLAVDQSREVDSQYAGRYLEWKEQERSKETTNTRKKQEQQTQPYLSFEDGKRGLCMVLPRTIMANEWIDDVEWRIKCDDGTDVIKRMAVFGNEGRRFIQSITVPVCASSTYTVNLVDTSEVNSNISSWEVSGIDEDGIIFFNANGRRITPNYLQTPYGIMICSGSAKIEESMHITTTYQSYPTDRDGFSVISVEPTGRNAELTYSQKGDKKTIRLRPQIDMSFDGKTLFSLPLDCNNGLYTEVPDLYINIDETAVTAGLTLKFGKDSIDISDRFEEGKAIVSLKKDAKDYFSTYGTYSVRLYQNEKFLRQVEFSYIPSVETNYSPFLKWPEEGEKRTKKYTFKKIEGWQLEFDGCTVKSDESNYYVEVPTNRDVVKGRIVSTDIDKEFSYGFRLPVKPFSVEVWKSDGILSEIIADRSTSIAVSDIDDYEYWVGLETFGEYTNYSYQLKLRTVNGLQQEATIKMAHNGCGNINLSVLYDTLRNCPLPAQVELWCEEDENRKIPIIVFKDFTELNVRPSLTIIKGKLYIVLNEKDKEKNITVRRFGLAPFEFISQYKDAIKTTLKKNNKEVLCYSVKGELKEGIYVIEANKNEESFFVEEASECYLSHNKNTFFIPDTANNKNMDPFSEWIKNLIIDIILAGIDADIKDKNTYLSIEKLNGINKTVFYSKDYEYIIALAYFAEATCLDEKKESIKKCMKEISKNILNAASRLELLRILLQMDVSQEIFDLCVDRYDLILFELKTDDACELAEKIKKYSVLLSMLLLMGADAPVSDTIRSNCEDIGKDAICSLLSVSDKIDHRAAMMERGKFLNDISPCTIQITLPTEISGEMGPIQEMFNYNYKHTGGKSVTLEFDLNKKQDSGIYFAQIKYVDQYVNWYKSSHTKEGEMYPEIKDTMLDVVQENFKDIMEQIRKLQNEPEIGKCLMQYEKALSARTSGDIYANMKANDHTRYFYLQGMAAFLAKLPSNCQEFKEAVRVGGKYMIEAMRVAPKMAKRDLIMASTFIYLKRKEEKLCR